MKNILCIIMWFYVSGAALNAQEIEYLTPTLIDFGRIKQGETAADTIRFVNSGDMPVHIAKVKTSCGCTASQVEKKEILPGDTGSVSLKLRTAGYQGTIRKDLRIYFEGDVLPVTRFTLQADIFTELSIHPKYLRFQTVPVNPDTVILRTFRIKNHSDRDVRLTLTPPKSDVIHILPDKAAIKPEASQEFTVALTPNEKKNQAVHLIIETSHEQKSYLNLPVFIHIIEPM